MGLDMYLYRKIYVTSYDGKKFDVNITLNGNPTNIDPNKISYLVEEIGYWRKANAIHKWFVDNVQDGKDNCGEYYVSEEKLQKLHDLCEKVLDNHNLAHELLPSTSGFFFGSTQYDNWYFDKLHDTMTICKDALKLVQDNNFVIGSSFYYHSSW